MPEPVLDLYQPVRDYTRDELIVELASMPLRLREIVGPRDAAEMTRRDGDGWSALDVVLHARDIVQVYGMRFKWIILQDDPFLPNYHEDAWVERSPDGVDDIDAVLGEIEAYRAETVRLLRGLSPDGWSRTGRHEVMGAVALEPYVAHQVAHEAQHIAQLRAALG